MEFSQFLTALVGAFFGASGWLVVGLYLSRRQFERQARNAARAVYFELTMNEIDIDVALKHSVFQPLRRGSFDRLLPELATWLAPDELQAIVRSYMSHAGYDQAHRETHLPAPVRAALLGRVRSEHRTASDLLRRRAFSASDAARLMDTPAAEGGRAPAGSATTEKPA